MITEAVVQHRYRGVSDPDQAWILGELISYMEHDASGCTGFADMGPNWVSVRDSAHNGTLRASDPDAHDVAQRWQQFADYLALGLAQELGADVSIVRARNSTTDQRAQETTRALAETGVLSAQIKVPDAIGAMTIAADLRGKRTLASVTVQAPEDGRPQTRLNWLLRQLKDAPGALRIEVGFAGSRETTSCLLSDARENPGLLLSPTDAKRAPRRFVLELARPLGIKRGRGKGTFVTEIKQHATLFYADIVQGLTPWRAKAPKLREEPTGDVDGPSRETDAVAGPLS